MDDEFKGLHEALGAADGCVVPPVDAYSNIDPELAALWRADGWCRYGQGVLWIVAPWEFSEVAHSLTALPSGAQVFARTAFADLFLLSDGEVWMLDVQSGEVKSLGPDVYIFLNSTLKLAEFKTSALKSDLLPALVARLGELSVDECYGLFPAQLLGGDPDDLMAYHRVKTLEYISTLAQVWA